MNSFVTNTVAVYDNHPDPINPDDDERDLFPIGDTIQAGQIANVNIHLSYHNGWRTPPGFEAYSGPATISSTPQLPLVYLYIKDGGGIVAQIAALYKRKDPMADVMCSTTEYFTKVVLGPGEKLVMVISGGQLGIDNGIGDYYSEAVYATTTGYITTNEEEIIDIIA